MRMEVYSIGWFVKMGEVTGTVTGRTDCYGDRIGYAIQRWNWCGACQCYGYSSVPQRECRCRLLKLWRGMGMPSSFGG